MRTLDDAARRGRRRHPARRRPPRQRRLLRRRAVREDEAPLAVHQRRPRHGRRRRRAAREHRVRPHRRRRARRVPRRAQGPGRRVRLGAARARPTSSSPRTSAARRRRRRRRSAGSWPASSPASCTRAAPSCRSTCPPCIAPPLETGARIGYLHVNVPGVLAEVNQVLADQGGNVTGQYLATRGEQGYVVTDVETLSPDALAELQASPHTIWLRTWTASA